MPPATQQQLGQIEVLLGEAEQNLNTDRKLEAAHRGAGTVVLPMLFNLGEPRGNPDQPLPEFVLKNNLTGVEDNVGAGSAGLYPLSTVGVLLPLEALGNGASAIGHLNAAPDVDGSIRTEPLVLRYYDNFYPSLALMIAARSLNLLPKDVKVQLGEGVRLGKLAIRTDPSLQMYTYFYKDRDGRPAFQVDSFFDVLQRQDSGGQVPGQDRAHRRDRRGRGHDPGDADLAGHGAGADAGAFGLEHPRGAFLRAAGLGHLGLARRVRAGRRLPDRCCCRGSRRGAGGR